MLNRTSDRNSSRGEDVGISLPAIMYNSNTSVEEALLNRKSIRDYRDRPIALSQLGQLLWAAQGITRPEEGKRTAPSAGARFPLETYVIARSIKELDSGIYHYLPQSHELRRCSDQDVILPLARAAVNQEWIAAASAVLLLAADYQRTISRYGQRGERYVHMDVGIAAQNVYLQAESLGLGTVFVGSFNDDQIHSITGLPQEERPLCLLPVGWPK